MTHHWGYVGALASAALFGVSSTLNKIALEGVHPLVVAGAIYFIGGVLLFGIHLSPLHKKLLHLFETPTKTETRISKKDVVDKLASRLSVDQDVAENYLDAVTETLYEAFKAGNGVTLPNFGSFYLDRRRSGCVFKFNPSQRLKALLGWSSSYKGPL